MVNGNYVLYGDRPSSESEIVNDHVQTRTAERKNRRKTNRTANELQRTLNMAQLDNETDSVKYEKKIKEPRLLRYVSTSDVEENFVNEKFETYDLKPTEERPRRYAFQKKPKNPADGSVNYAYSRSSSSCSSPNGNLPTISEHGEQYGTYRVRSAPSPAVGDFINAYESKIDKYFTKPKESKGFAGKISYKGSHPDSLYRVPSGAGVGGDKMARVLRVLRWPVALVAVCIALAVFVYFLMPDNIDRDLTAANRTYWEPIAAGASHGSHGQKHQEKPDILPTPYGTKTPEIDFYDAENEKVDFTSIMDPKITETKQRILPIKPVFPEHIAPEVQYGNEKADSEKLRMAKALEEANRLPQDSTLKPHITQKPEKPLAVYFKEGYAETTTTTEAITRAETINEFTNYGDKQISKIIEEVSKTYGSIHKEPAKEIPLNVKQYLVTEPEITRESQDYYSRQPGDVHVKFTSGHSNLFGISIEDAEKMRSTTQSSLYNTRVSPTLPTWRDGDDTTTKKYPINVNYEVPQCRSTRLSVCRGVLPYDLAGAPATISDVEVTTFLPQIEYLISTNCSERVKHFACSLMEPECSPPPYPPKMPCYNLCKAILDSCDGFIPHELMPAFKCGQYSRTNCIGARVPCYHREFTCSDQSCVPRDWMCDGTNDCPNGEDELSCAMCEKNEFRCRTGTCILKRWLCDGYSDCPGGEDETETCDRHLAGEPGEESAGSAPAPAVRRPNRLSGVSRTAVVHRTTGESDSSKELLITSDSSHSFKRNFTRRPSPSRLSPYSRTSVTQTITHKSETVPAQIPSKKMESRQKPEPPKITQKPENNESQEDVNIGDLGFLDDIKKTSKEATDELKKTNEETRSKEAMPMPQMEQKAQPKPKAKAAKAPVAASTVPPRPTKLDKSLNKMEKVLNGAALLKQMAAEEETNSPETNSTTFEPEDLPPIPEPKSSRTGSKSAHASPCPSGELRCVDGRCITLAQLCDGTIDCSDHADEDNCFT